MKKYGYIRVPTKEQNPERQYAALEQHTNQFGRSRKSVFIYA